MRRQRRAPALGTLKPWISRARQTLSMSAEQARSTLPFYRRALAAEIVRLVILERAELSDAAREALGALESN